jgi:asparagine synthase (glutamine-hydrolysing)
MPASPKLAPLVAGQAGVAEIAKPDRILSRFRAAGGKREGFAAWHLLFYALWHRRHMQGAAPAGDVFETLSQK